MEYCNEKNICRRCNCIKNNTPRVIYKLGVIQIEERLSQLLLYDHYFPPIAKYELFFKQLIKHKKASSPSCIIPKCLPIITAPERAVRNVR